MGKWFKTSAYGILAVLGVSLAVMVGMTAIETALVSHSSTGNDSSVSEHSSVADYSVPSEHASLRVDFGPDDLNLEIRVTCVAPNGRTWYWSAASSDMIGQGAFVNVGEPIPKDTTCTLTEEISNNPWAWDVYTSTDADSSPVLGRTRSVVLHEGQNNISITNDGVGDNAIRTGFEARVELLGDPAPTGDRFGVQYGCSRELEGVGWIGTGAGLIYETGGLFTLYNRAEGERCAVRIFPWGVTTNWTWNNDTEIIVFHQADQYRDYNLKYFDPALHEPGKLKITSEVIAPADTEAEFDFNVACDNTGQQYSYPDDFTNGSLELPMGEVTGQIYCGINIGYPNNDQTAWDRKVNGECSSYLTQFLTVNPDETTLLAFSHTWVEPYVAQCRTSDS